MTSEEFAKLAEPIKARIRGGCIYGMPIDETSLDQMVCAAYLLGTQERRRDEAVLRGEKP